jgi:lathosterol oxidase
MDIVLEILDYLLFDRLYAQILPDASASNAYSSLKGTANATLASLRDVPTPPYNGYQYHPSTQYFTLEPTKWAYMTSWPRDDPMRQLFSLFLITWYDHLHQHS